MSLIRGSSYALDDPEVQEALDQIQPIEDVIRTEIEWAVEVHEKYRVPWRFIAARLGITKKALLDRRKKHGLP